MPGNFESAVAGFLQGYSLVSGIKSQKKQDRIAAQRAATADQAATIRMDEAGYERITMPTIVAPPGQNFAQRVGRFLRGGPEEPGSIVMKTHPSVRETEIAGARQAHLTDVSAANQQDLLMEGVRAADARKLEAMREASANRLNQDDNATAITVAGMNRATSKAALTQTAKHSVVDDAIDATGGYAERAWNSIPADVKKQHGITITDMNAGVERWRDSKARLSREGMQSREDIAAGKAGGSFLGGAGPGVKPPALAPSDKAAAVKDPAFAAHLVSLGYVKGRDF